MKYAKFAVPHGNYFVESFDKHSNSFKEVYAEVGCGTDYVYVDN
jgi:hypothetical protein